MSPEQRAQLQAPGRVAARGHGPALADGPAGRATSSRPSPRPAGSSATSSAATEPHGPGRGHRRGRPAWASSTSSRQFLRSAILAGALAEVDLDEVAKHLGEDAAGRSTAWPSWPSSSTRPASSSSARAATSSPPRACAASASRRCPTCSRQLTKDRGRATTSTSWTAPATTARRPTKPYEFGDPFNLDLSAHRAQRRPPVGERACRCACTPDDFEVVETEAPDPLGHRAPGRPVPVDAHARQLRAGQEDRHGPAHPDHHPVPPRLPRPGRLLRGGPGDQARGPPHASAGTTSTAPTSSTG